jgi:replicative DNA helicase
VSDLSQSEILEMVANNIILLYWYEYYKPDKEDQAILVSIPLIKICAKKLQLIEN